MEVSAKRASVKTTRTLATWGVFTTREPHVPSPKYTTAFFKVMGWFIILPGTFVLST